MQDPATLSRAKLLQRVGKQKTQLGQQKVRLQARDAELVGKDSELATKDSELAKKDDIIRQMEQKYRDLQLDYSKLYQERFNAKSERYIDNPNQLRLDFGNTDAAADAADGLADATDDADLIPAHRRRKPRKKRDEGLPAHLPRYEVTADVPDELKNCETHGERTLLPEAMWDKTETLEHERPVLKVRVTKFPKYSCPGQPQCGIAAPERPIGIVEGNKYDTSRPPASVLAVPVRRSSPPSSVTTCRFTGSKITSPVVVGRLAAARC